MTLKYFATQPKLSSKQVRWQDTLALFNVDIRHKPGKENIVPDALSRNVAPLLWPSVGVKPNTWKSRELESSGTPECSEFNRKAQNTSPWGVLGVIGKVSKCRCPKWPRIGNLDICNLSYGRKKGRESNWQFDSRPLKVGNRPVPDVRSGSATWRWKALFEGYRIV